MYYLQLECLSNIEQRKRIVEGWTINFSKSKIGIPCSKFN